MRRALGLAGVIAALASSAAQAQPVKPHILVIFDTSGSMLDDNRDGSPLCGGLGTASRLYSLKQALREALVQVGADEANVGLMRFAQREDPTIDPECSEGHYFQDDSTKVGTHRGCKIASHADEPSYGPWFASDYRQVVLVDVTRTPSPGPVASSADFDPTDANIPAVYRWIDLSEDADDVAPISDPELRSGSGFYTPLGRSLFYARMYFDNFVKPNDPRSECRTNLVLLVTDGDETCDPEGGTVNADCSGDASEFAPRRAACRLLHDSGIKTHVITDTETSDQNDDIAAAGGTGSAIRVTLTDTSAVRAQLVGIIAGAVPPAEVCNGLDDNCNGLSDEGVKNACPLDPVDLKHCAVETCNCADDDCDGEVDEGLPLNACGGPCGCLGTEVCDNIDNDCDGDIDEGFDVGAACDNGKTGDCKRTGIKACAADKMGTVCTAPDAPTMPEVCNGLDDNCNGMTDEGTLPGVGEACGADVGMCKMGKLVCTMGKLVCDGTDTKKPETCNGLDDDCNGITDDGMFPEVGMACLCPGLDPMQAGVGECKGGKLACLGAKGFACEGCVLPLPEICDGKDNDCDGVVDKEAPCPIGFTCSGGQCAIECGKGEFSCPAGYTCDKGFCIRRRCADVVCPAGELCNESDGKCADPCRGVTCEAPRTCVAGSCVDCYGGIKCKEGERCQAGVCAPDKCAGVSCPVNQYCDSGSCRASCAGVACAAGQTCVAGACHDDKCAQVACPRFQRCDPTTGVCGDDPCLTKMCPRGQVCLGTTGACIPDPCDSITCAAHCQACAVTAEGVGHCAFDPACGGKQVKVNAGGGGGCTVLPKRAADTRRAPDPASALALLLAAFALRRRRC